MNGSLAANSVLLNEIKIGLGQPACTVAVCVPAPYFAQCRVELAASSIVWGGQDISVHESGAYTGEISGMMLADFGCGCVIVGHSERRIYHAEGDDLVAQKTLAALRAGLTPIVCVGESLSERESNQTGVVVGRQVDAVLAVIEVGDLAKIVIAYEPVWAIGSGLTATPPMAQVVHAMIRRRLLEKSPAAADSVRIIYGGSMKPENAGELLAMPDIDGGLIGGASLKASDFLAIVQSAQA
jgi:triosephosphate isomerase